MNQPESIEIQVHIAHPPARVWHALTDSQLLNRWLMPNDFEPRVGHCFTFDTGRNGSTECEVLELEFERLICMSWQNGALDTVVTFRLEPEGAGTRLYLTQTGFDPSIPQNLAAFLAMSEGWQAMLAKSLPDLLEADDLFRSWR
jgi:uncharacterized protein YndB with AHSA1/START domain